MPALMVMAWSRKGRLYPQQTWPVLVVQPLFQIRPSFGEAQKKGQRRRTQQQPCRGRRRHQRTAEQHANHESRGEQEHVEQGDVLGPKIVGQVDDHVREHNRHYGLRVPGGQT